MSEKFWKLEIVPWNDGTDCLTLEQEGALLRICNAINLYDRPINDNVFILCGLFRCNDRKAKRLVRELVAAGKIQILDGKIHNKKASETVSSRVRIATGKQSAGRRGGVESGKTRSKPLNNKELHEAYASTENEQDKIREDKKEKKTPPTPPKGGDGGGILEKGKRLLDVVGVSFNDPSWYGDFSIISRWESDGLDFEFDILPAIQQAVSKSKKNGKPRSLKYYDRPVRDWHARRKPDKGLVDHFVAKKDSAQWKAWRSHMIETGKTVKAMDIQESWVVPTEWPPSEGAELETKH